MTESELYTVRSIVDREGFDYAFRFYGSAFEHIKDKEFYRLRKAYTKAASDLEKYFTGVDVIKETE